MQIQWQTWGPQAAHNAREQDQLLAVWCHDPLDHYSDRWLRDLAADDECSAAISQTTVPVLLDITQQPAVAARVQEC